MVPLAPVIIVCFVFLSGCSYFGCGGKGQRGSCKDVSQGIGCWLSRLLRNWGCHWGPLVEATKAIVIILNLCNSLSRCLIPNVIKEFTKGVSNAVVRSHGRWIEEIKWLEGSGSGCLL